MIGLRLYLAQRISALVMAPLVIGHIAVMIYAVQNGLSAVEILSRTQGSLWWGGFYGLFVAAVAVHAAIGVRAIIYETFGTHVRWLDPLTWTIGLGLFLLGGRAVAAVVL
ncbi:MAG: succinate dehydrogenase [Alphaproteobacteria bacterium]|nr:succinate dehydrogenase [Alphaproteobacteria bacterium]